MTDKQAWRNRIVGQGTKPASQFMANPNNWRKHPQNQRDALKGILSEVGWVQTVIENVRTGHLIDGHERIWDALQNGDQDVPYVQVDLSPEEEALVLATFDPISAMAQSDAEQLDALLCETTTGDAALQQLISDLAEDAGLYRENDPYSNKIEAPVYEPSVVKPNVSDLFDDTRTQKLIGDIEAAEWLTDEEREFLIVAARRYTVLDFHKIADYYAHSGPDVQRLMEDSALVIIDFDKAIELGYVQLSKDIAALVKDEYEE